MEKTIKVLVVDDSAVMRKLLTHALSLDPHITVVGAAPDPLVAREYVIQHKPDVIILDIEMPKMDGLTFLKKIMEFIPTRVLIFSSVAAAGSANALKALELGAIDVLEKPSADITKNMELLSRLITEKVRLVASAKLIKQELFKNSLKHSNPQIGKSSQYLSQTTHKVLAVASSTGGTEALKRLLSAFPANIPGTLITQHMPAGFTKMFAKSLNEMFPFEVKEAESGDQVRPGLVLLAPGNFHMEIERQGGYYQVKLHQEPLLHGVRPAADYMMKSVAHHAGKNAVGVVLTGMGKDGAEGLLAMRQAGAVTYAQSEKTCVVFGMPAAAIALQAAQYVLDLDEIGPHILNQLRMSLAG